MENLQNSVTPLQKSARSVFRIIPAGAFSADDGRPDGNWFLSEQIGRAIISLAAQRKDDYLIDYEHQTLTARTNNQPAPAAGWFKQLEWRTDGLYVLDARWTEKAKAMIEAGEYRFISPVFSFTPGNGMVTGLHSVALTNTPALHGLTDLSLAAATARQVNSDMPDLSGMSEKDRATYIHTFGHLFPALAAATASQGAQSEMPDLSGMSEKDRNTYIHTFGHLFPGLTATQG